MVICMNELINVFKDDNVPVYLFILMRTKEPMLYGVFGNWVRHQLCNKIKLNNEETIDSNLGHWVIFSE